MCRAPDGSPYLDLVEAPCLSELSNGALLDNLRQRSEESSVEVTKEQSVTPNVNNNVLNHWNQLGKVRHAAPGLPRRPSRRDSQRSKAVTY